jgi:hypothetical protein
MDESSAREIDDVSGRDQVFSSSSRFASPEDLKSKSKPAVEYTMEVTSSEKEVNKKSSLDVLKDGSVISLRSRDQPGFHVARQCMPGGGWFLDVLSNVTKRDPAAQFMVTFRNKASFFWSYFIFGAIYLFLNSTIFSIVLLCFYQDTIGLRSFASGGKLLQVRPFLSFRVTKKLQNSTLILCSSRQ